jgi:hypothetical protein
LKILDQTVRNQYRITHLTYQAGPGRIVTARLVEPEQEKSQERAVLYVDAGGEEAIAPGGDVEQLAQLGYTVLAVELSGKGKSASDDSEDSDSAYGPGKIAWLALMVGKPLVGLRMDDILRGVDLLGEKGLLHDGHCLGFGKGIAAVDLLHAAAMDQRIAGVVIEDGLLSYGSIARTPIHRQIFGEIVPDVLGTYDLPDLVASLAPRSVQLVNLRSPAGNIVFLHEVQSEYTYAVKSYTALGFEGQLKIGRRREGESISTAYPDLR